MKPKAQKAWGVYSDTLWYAGSAGQFAVYDSEEDAAGDETILGGKVYPVLITPLEVKRGKK